MVRTRPIIWIFAKTIDFFFSCKNIPVWRKIKRNTQHLNSHQFPCKYLRHENSPGMLTYTQPCKDSEKLKQQSQLLKVQSWYCCTLKALPQSGLEKDLWAFTDIPLNPQTLSPEIFLTQDAFSLKRNLCSSKLMEKWTNLNTEVLLCYSAFQMVSKQLVTDLFMFSRKERKYYYFLYGKQFP